MAASKNVCISLRSIIFECVMTGARAAGISPIDLGSVLIGFVSLRNMDAPVGPSDIRLIPGDSSESASVAADSYCDDPVLEPIETLSIAAIA